MRLQGHLYHKICKDLGHFILILCVKFAQFDCLFHESTGELMLVQDYL